MRLIPTIANRWQLWATHGLCTHHGRQLWATHGLCLRGSRCFYLCFQFRSDLDDRRGLLDGVKHFAGGAMIELAGAERLDDLGERGLHGGEVFESGKVHAVRHLLAERAGAAQAASARDEVVMTIFAALKSGRAAVNSVFF